MLEAINEDWIRVQTPDDNEHEPERMFSYVTLVDNGFASGSTSIQPEG